MTHTTLFTFEKGAQLYAKKWKWKLN